MYRRALGETNGERERQRMRRRVAEEGERWRVGMVGKESLVASGEERREWEGGRRRDGKNTLAKEKERERERKRRPGEGLQHARRGKGGGSIVINIYFLGSFLPAPLSLLPCAYAQSRLESSYAIKWVRAFELSARARVWKVVRFPNRSGKERRKKTGRSQRSRRTAGRSGETSFREIVYFPVSNYSPARVPSFPWLFATIQPRCFHLSSAENLSAWRLYRIRQLARPLRIFFFPPFSSFYSFITHARSTLAPLGSFTFLRASIIVRRGLLLTQIRVHFVATRAAVTNLVAVFFYHHSPVRCVTPLHIATFVTAHISLRFFFYFFFPSHASFHCCRPEFHAGVRVFPLMRARDSPLPAVSQRTENTLHSSFFDEKSIPPSL